MLGSIPVVSEVFQALLNALGWVLATIYRFVPNYGAAIIILTLLIKVLLLPLSAKQIKSMQLTQALGPKIKEIQKKYKGNKAKAQEEQMKLYKEVGVHPLGGCLPLILSFPVLISMFAVLRMPILEAAPPAEGQGTSYIVQNNHLPVDSQLFANVIEHENTGVIIVNLQCSIKDKLSPGTLQDKQGNPIEPGKPLINGATGDPIPNLTSRSTLDCGTGPITIAPYILLVVVMVGTTFYQQRQMQRAAPASAVGGQQQAILKYMPLMFGVSGYFFPASLVLYWTVSNGFQIGQQFLMMRAGHIGPDALDRRTAAQREKNAVKGGKPEKKGYMARMLEQAQQQKNDPKGTKPAAKGGKPPSTPPRSSGPRRKPNTGGNKGGSGGSKGGGSKGAGPKKRPGGGGDDSAG